MAQQPNVDPFDEKSQSQPFAPVPHSIPPASVDGPYPTHGLPAGASNLPYGVPVYNFPPPPPFQEGAMPVYGEYLEMQHMGHHPASYAQFHDEKQLGELPPVSFPMGIELDAQNFQDHILSQDYQINIRKIFSLGWNCYKQHWMAFTLFTLFQILIWFIPYIGEFFVLPLSVGIFISVSNKIRSGNLDAEIKYDHFFYGYLFCIPLFFIGVFSSIVYGLGLLLCIIPGIYAMFVLAFSIPVFLEYHSLNVGIIGSMILSQKVVNKHFIDVAAFLLMNFLFVLVGIFAFGVGGLITIPMSQINLVFAFREMFGLNPQKIQEKGCVIC